MVKAEWQSANIEASVAAAEAGNRPVSWKKPPLNTLKCNVDSAIFADRKKMGFGGVLCDSNGEFVAAIQGSLPGTFSPILAEAIGLREVLSWIKESSFGSILVETDSQFLLMRLIVQ